MTHLGISLTGAEEAEFWPRPQPWDLGFVVLGSGCRI